MTVSAKRHEIAFFVIPEVASGLDMMHLEIFHAATMLAPPAVAIQDLLPQLLVWPWIESQSRRLSVPRVHGAIDIRCLSCAFIASGRNSMRRQCPDAGYPLRGRRCRRES